MNTKTLLVLLLLSQQAFTKEQEDCLQSYKDSLQKKEARYHKAYERYKKQTNAGMSYSIAGQARNDFGLALGGSILLQNAQPPSRSDYDMFEADIIKAVEADLSKFISLKPMVLEGIYNAAYEKHSDVTYERIQNLILKGFLEGKFCTLMGKKRVPGIQRYVLRELNKTNSETAFSRDIAVVDDEDGKDYQVDEESMHEELEKPLEPKSIQE